MKIIRARAYLSEECALKIRQKSTLGLGVASVHSKVTHRLILYRPRPFAGVNPLKEKGPPIGAIDKGDIIEPVHL